MSDDDRDIDVESDEGEDSDSRQPTPSRQSSGSQYYSQAQKRAHHNALERKRRDHIKDSFTRLRDSVPALNGEKTSRAQMLKKTAEYIVFMKKKINSHQQHIDGLRRQNSLLKAQIRILEKTKTKDSFDAESSDEEDSNYNESESDTSDMEESVEPRRPKKLKLESYD